LLTRLIFVWFLKEKRHNSPLVPEELFQQSHLQNLIDLDDRDASTYYKAILQNLFFATLNQEMNTSQKSDNRKFRGKATAGQRDQHYMSTMSIVTTIYLSNQNKPFGYLNRFPSSMAVCLNA